MAICTWNRADLLAQTLEQLTHAQVPVATPWQVLVVDNNSNDHTPAVVERFAGRLPVAYWLEPRQGKSHALNRILDSVTDGLLLLTDDDVLVEPQWLTAFVQAANAHPEAAIFGGPIDPWFPQPVDPDLAAAFPALRTGFCGMNAGLFARNGGIPYGANMGLRRSFLGDHRFRLDLGPTSTFQGGGEEVEFCSRLIAAGARSVWCPQMALRHYVAPRRMTLTYLKQFYADGARRDVRLEPVTAEQVALAGAPLWMLKHWMRCMAGQVVCRAIGRRRQSLEYLRERVEWGGRIAEWRGILQTRTTPGAKNAREPEDVRL